MSAREELTRPRVSASHVWTTLVTRRHRDVCPVTPSLSVGAGVPQDEHEPNKGEHGSTVSHTDSVSYEADTMSSPLNFHKALIQDKAHMSTLAAHIQPRNTLMSEAWVAVGSLVSEL